MLGNTQIANAKKSNCHNHARSDRGGGRRNLAGRMTGRSIMKLSDTNFPFNIAEVAFQPSAAFRDAMRQAASRFWRGQDQILDAMQDYATGWFERRQAGTEAALATAQHVIDAATPVEAMREYQKWAFGSFERMIDDGLSCQQHLLSMSAWLSPPLSPSGERTEPERVTEESESKRRSPSRAAA
jgi:hypothetical protein